MYPSVVDLAFTAIASVTQTNFRYVSKDALYLCKHVRQSVAVVAVLFKGQGANKNIGVPGFGDGSLGAKFVFLVVFAFAHAVDVRLVQAVDFVFVTAFLFEYTAIEIEDFLLFLLLRVIQFTLYFPQ